MAENIFKRARNKFRNSKFRRWFVDDHDHYQRSFLITLLISLGLLPFLICGGGFSLAEWFLYLYAPTAFVGGSLSGATYIGALVDEPTHRYEKIGTVLLGTFAVAATIALIALRVTVPFLDVVGDIAYAIFGIRAINTIGGMGYRLGATGNDKRPGNERAAIAVSSVLGVGAGVTMALTCSAGLTTGSLAVIIPGMAIAAALPVIPATILAGVVVGSVCASAADYTSKAWNYLRYASGKKYDNYHLHNRFEEERIREYQGATIGVAAGLVVGGIIAALALPYLALGLVGVAAAGLAVAVVVLTVVTCVSVFGSLCSKVGRYLDKKRVDSKKEESKKEENKSLLPKNSSDKLDSDDALTVKPNQSPNPNMRHRQPANKGSSSAPFPHSLPGNNVSNISISAKITRLVGQKRKAPDNLEDADPSAKKQKTIVSVANAVITQSAPAVTTPAKLTQLLGQKCKAPDNLEDTAPPAKKQKTAGSVSNAVVTQSEPIGRIERKIVTAKPEQSQKTATSEATKEKNVATESEGKKNRAATNFFVVLPQGDNYKAKITESYKVPNDILSAKVLPTIGKFQKKNNIRTNKNNCTKIENQRTAIEYVRAVY